MDIGDSGDCKGMILKDQGFRSGVYMYQGRLTSEILGKVFDLPFKNIEWLLAGR